MKRRHEKSPPSRRKLEGFSIKTIEGLDPY
jgi:hypothetical protein